MAQNSGLLGLSHELLGRICSQFCPHCVGEDCLSGFELPSGFWGPEYFGTLAALAQVNVRFGRLAQRVRLHIFCGRRESLPLLARSLVEKPALAANIFVVRLGDRDRDTNRGCILRELATPQDVEQLKALAAPNLPADFDLLCDQGEKRLLAPFEALPPIADSFFAPPAPNDVVMGVRGDSPPAWGPGDAEAVIGHIANARLNAFLVFKMAKNIRSIAILSEWPLAVFPEPTSSPKIVVKQAKHKHANAVVPGTLPKVEQLRLDNSEENRRRDSNQCMVDMGKSAALLAHLPTLRSFKIRRGHINLLANRLPEASPSALANLTTLDLTGASVEGTKYILSWCQATSLKHFRFTIAEAGNNAFHPGHDVQGHTVISLLAEYNLNKTLITLHINTAGSTDFADDPGRIPETFHTTETLAEFTALRHLAISIDNIYYPSQIPRILYRDDNTGIEGERLISFLPKQIESVEITAIHAIHSGDMTQLATACQQPGGGFRNLRKVTLKGIDKREMSIRNATWARHPVPDDDFADWFDLESYAESNNRAGVHQDIAEAFGKAGVKYEFDAPEYYFWLYAADWNKPGVEEDNNFPFSIGP